MPRRAGEQAVERRGEGAIPLPNAIAFLTSPGVSYITGAVLDVNGGYYM